MTKVVCCDRCGKRKRENAADGWFHLEPIGPLTVRGFAVGTNDFCGIQCLLAFVVEKAGSLAANPNPAMLDSHIVAPVIRDEDET